MQTINHNKPIYTFYIKNKVVLNIKVDWLSLQKEGQRPQIEYIPQSVYTLIVYFVLSCLWHQGWCAVWLKLDLSPKLNMNKEELSQP